MKRLAVLLPIITVAVINLVGTKPTYALNLIDAKPSAMRILGQLIAGQPFTVEFDYALEDQTVTGFRLFANGVMVMDRPVSILVDGVGRFDNVTLNSGSYELRAIAYNTTQESGFSSALLITVGSTTAPQIRPVGDLRFIGGSGTAPPPPPPPDPTGAPVVVQTSSEVVVAGALTGSISLPGVRQGSLLVATVAQATSALRTYSAASVGTSWQSAIQLNPGRAVAILYSPNAVGGDTTVTVAASSSTSFRFRVFEVAGASALDVTSGIHELVNSNSHVCAADPTVIDTAPNVIVFCAAQLSSSATAVVAGAGYTAYQVSGTDPGIFQHKSSATALVDEQGAFTNTGTARISLGVIAAFRAVQ